MEAVADDLRGVGDGDEGVRLVDTDEVAEPDGLGAAHDGDDDGLILFFVIPHRVVRGRAPMRVWMM